jgi:hypothetical protein
MSTKIAALVSVVALAVAGSAFAQDYRSPDAKPAVVPSQDLRSPDAKIAAFPSIPAVQDQRSPDARPSGRFLPGPASTPSHSADSFAWGYLALGIALAGVLTIVLTLTQRRRHRVAVGS